MTYFQNCENVKSPAETAEGMSDQAQEPELRCCRSMLGMVAGEFGCPHWPSNSHSSHGAGAIKVSYL